MVDDDRFRQVWTTHSQAVLRYCIFSSGSRDEGEDLAVEVFSRYLVSGERVTGERVEQWLFRVARNLCASHHRKVAAAKRAIARMQELPAAVEDVWLDPELWSAVRNLPENDRLGIYLRFVEDRSFADVASAMGKSEAAAKKCVYRALERVRKRLGTGDGLAESRDEGVNHA